MNRRSPAILFAVFWLIATWGCGPQPSLATDLKLTPTMSGYFDAGLNDQKHNRLLPSLTFELSNTGTLPFTNVDLVVAFWEVGADGELDSKVIRGVANQPLEPGKKGEAITVRSSVGYESEAPRAEFFANQRYRGFIIKVFAKRGGKQAKLGEFPVEARLLPAVSKDGSHP